MNCAVAEDVGSVAKPLDRMDDGETSQTDSSSSLERLSSSDDEPDSALEQSGRALRAGCRPPRRNRELPYTRSKGRWRLRPKDELEYLRNKVDELEQLARKLRVSGAPPSREERLVSTCEKKRLDAALEENKRLRARLYDRIRVAAALERAIDVHMKVMAQRVPWPSTRDAANVSDELMFALLEERIPGQLALLDQVMETSGLSRINRQLLTTLQFHQDAHGVSFHHNEVRLLPYSVADVTRALSNCLTHGTATKNCRKIMRSDNGFYAVMVDSMQTPEAHLVEIKGRHTQRCVTKADRTVITWTSCMEYYCGREFLRLFKKIWVSIVPIHPTAGHEAVGTIMRVVVQLQPTEADLSSTEASRIKEMADIVIRAHHRGADLVYQAMLDQLKVFAP